jgi:hypothetical protein
VDERRSIERRKHQIQKRQAENAGEKSFQLGECVRELKKVERENLLHKKVFLPYRCAA